MCVLSCERGKEEREHVSLLVSEIRVPEFIL